MDFKIEPCAITPEKHVIDDQISLPCGHKSCKSCIVREIFNNCILKCEICDRGNFTDFIINAKSHVLENIDEYFERMKRQFSKSLDYFKENSRLKKEQLSIQVNYIREEIDIKIECLKTQLDELSECMINQLNDIERNAIKEIVIDEQEFECKFECLRSETKRDKTEMFLEYQDEVMELNKKANDLNDLNYELKFIISTEFIHQSMIGELSFHSTNGSNEKIRTILKCPTSIKEIEIDANAYDLCLLPNNTIIASNVNNLIIYNNDLQLIKIVDKINNQSFKSVFIATDSVNRLFITDDINHVIYMTDLQLNYLASAGSRGTGSRQFTFPRGLSYYNGHLYACDYSNKRIQKLNDKLEFVNLYQLDYIPWQIKIENNIACVRAWTLTSILFYSLDKFTLKHKYDDHNGTISLINLNFYEYVASKKIIYCYDQDGVLNETIEMQQQFKDRAYNYNPYDGCLVFTNNKSIIMSFNKAEKIFKIK